MASTDPAVDPPGQTGLPVTPTTLKHLHSTASTDPAIAIIHIDLGPAAAFDQNVFPLAYYECGDNFSKGSFLIKATLEEMEEIKRLGIDLNKNEDFIFNTRLTIEALVLIRGPHMSAHASVV